MKHILIVDLTDDSKCGGCPCLDIWGICMALPHDPFGGAENIDYIRPSDCPLKPMPNKRRLPKSEVDGTNYGEEPWFSDGWNACIDCITRRKKKR